jgi:fatty acid CoA ligase FadD36
VSTPFLAALDGRFGDHADAVVVGDEALSWEGLRARAGAVGARISGLSMVAVEATPTLDTVVAVVAGLLSGTPVVPVPPDAGPMERDHVLSDAAASAVLGAPDWPDVSLPRLPLSAGVGVAFSEPPADATALVVYTSGTTGLPKGALLSRRALAADLDGLADAWAWTPDDVLVHGLPLFHVHGLVLGVLGALRVGSRLVHTVRPTPEAYAAAGGTLYFGVPTVWTRVCGDEAAARTLRRARLLVSGSAPLPVPVFERLEGLAGQRPVERYGMTETLITLSTRADGERRPGWVGLPLDGVETRLVGDDGGPVPHDGESIGHLHVRGTTLFDGYLGRPEATTEAYAPDGWLVTGDAASVDAGGFHRIAGRTSTDIIKTGGFKVGAGEVESALLAHPAVAEAAVIGVADADLGQRVVAYVVADGVDGAALQAFVAKVLSVHKRPREVHLVTSLPRNAMGKVQKARLVEP